MEIVKEDIGKVHVISLVGRIDTTNVILFQNALEESILAGHYLLLLNLQKLEYLSSSALRFLYKALAMIDQKASDNGKILLAEPTDGVKKMLDFIDLSSDFPIFSKKEDALKAFEA